MKLTSNRLFDKPLYYLIFTAVTHLFIFQGLIPNSKAYISPNSIFKRILNVMTIEKALQEELQWKEDKLYAPDVVSNSASNSTIHGSDQEKETTQAETMKSEDEAIPTAVPLKGESTALLIVDVQPEYWTHCPSIRKDFPNFERDLKETINICRKQKAKIIWVRADYRHNHSPWLTQFERLNNGKRPDTRAELPCDPDSDDFAWEEFATPEGNEVIIAKKSWNSASNTDLLDYLRVSGIENVLVCGLITSVCVQHSAFSVFEAGYRTLLVEDACGDRGMERHRAALALYGNYMYEITTSKKLKDDKLGLQAAIPKWINVGNMKKRKRFFSVNSAEAKITQKNKVSDESDSSDTPVSVNKKR